MTYIKDEPIGQLIGEKHFMLTEPFIFYSDILGRECMVPIGFTCDLESVPVIRGTCRVGGIIHDYFCRKDSNPVVEKKDAADVYREFIVYRGGRWSWIKYWAVRFAPGYFHKFSVQDDIINGTS